MKKIQVRGSIAFALLVQLSVVSSQVSADVSGFEELCSAAGGTRRSESTAPSGYIENAGGAPLGARVYFPNGDSFTVSLSGSAPSAARVALHKTIQVAFLTGSKLNVCSGGGTAPETVLAVEVVN